MATREKDVREYRGPTLKLVEKPGRIQDAIDWKERMAIEVQRSTAKREGVNEVFKKREELVAGYQKRAHELRRDVLLPTIAKAKRAARHSIRCRAWAIKAKNPEHRRALLGKAEALMRNYRAIMDMTAIHNDVLGDERALLRDGMKEDLKSLTPGVLGDEHG